MRKIFHFHATCSFYLSQIILIYFTFVKQADQNMGRESMFYFNVLFHKGTELPRVHALGLDN